MQMLSQPWFKIRKLLIPFKMVLRGSKFLFKKSIVYFLNNAQRQQGFLGGYGRKNQILSVNLNRRLWVLENGLLQNVSTWLLTHPESGHSIGTPLNRNTFPSITQELPKKFALTSSKLLDQIPKTSEEGKQALWKKYRKVHPELSKGNIANGSNCQIYISTNFTKSTVWFGIY